jgi:hypothetical protein
MLYGLNGSKFGAKHMTNTSGRIVFDNANQAKAIDPAKVADMLNDLWSTSQNSLLPTIIKPSSSRFEGMLRDCRKSWISHSSMQTTSRIGTKLWTM